jgi:hypothetical protein
LTENPHVENPLTENPPVENPLTENPPVENPLTENPPVENPLTENPPVENPLTENPPVENPLTENPLTENPLTENPPVENPLTENPLTENPPAENPLTENPHMDSPPAENPFTTETNDVSSITIEIIETPPNPIVELMKQSSKIALLIGLNYVDSPEITLKNRINGINNVKQILLNMHGFTEDNILVLIEPVREKVVTTLNTIIGSSGLISEFIIYYSGYGNGIVKTDLGFCGQPGIIDNLSRQIMPADFAEIGQDELTSMLNHSCCKTVCIMDMCPYGNDDMLLKWGADVNNHVKMITLCESDSHNTNKNQLIQSMIRELRSTKA